MAQFDASSPLTWLRIGVASVWLLFGLVFKLLGFMPRHLQIVERVVGPRHARSVLRAVALAEVGLACWMLVGRALPACMAVQTALIAGMNTCELRYARDLLLSPVGMLLANAAFLSLGWYVALNAH